MNGKLNFFFFKLNLKYVHFKVCVVYPIRNDHQQFTYKSEAEKKN